MRCILKVIFFILLLPVLPSDVSSGEIDCLTCHRKLGKGTVVHAALEMGCGSCHTGIDAGKVPHRKTNTNAKGLSADQPELCYGCHDQGLFTKTNVHAAVSMGCTGCHNPHSSGNPHLLVAAGSDLCFNCHDSSAFSKKVVHAPVAAGMCAGCHSPHASEFVALLLKKPYDLCLDCHSEIPLKPHAIVGFGAGSHPVGQQKKTRRGEMKESADPARPGRTFYCGSCHEPHSADAGKLFRFNARTAMELCTKCHNM